MEEANHIVVRDVFGRLDAQAAFPGLNATVEQWRPDVVLRDPCEFGSLAAAERAGVPHAEVAISIGSLQLWTSDLLVEPLHELDEIVGLPARTCSAALASTPVFTSVPPSLEAGRGRTAKSAAAQRAPEVVRYRDGDRRGRAGSLPGRWGEADHPLVYVTFGSVTGGLADLRVVFGTCLEALAELPIRVLLTTGHAGDPEELRPWPANARVEQWWPQSDAMPFASAMVGHGGFGTTMSALAAGVPQVVVPLFAFDQEINATRVEEVGAGIRLDGRQEAAGRVGDAVSRVLDDPFMRSVAQAVAAEIASLPEVSEIVESIEGLASSR
jgi:glycosyltransferase